MVERPPYVGRFAPSPTGLLHAGSVVAALASWLDARAAGGRWLVRLEDVDTPRCVPGAAEAILRQLNELGLVPDAEPLRQSQRGALYASALTKLQQQGLAYPCACTRQNIAAAAQALGLTHVRDGERIYPGTCRQGLRGRPARAWRLLTEGPPLTHRRPEGARVVWQDRRLGAQQQDVSTAVGDFVLQRADGLWAYQLAVVVDDASQQVTDVVRGEDLADNTPRQVLLQQLLDMPTPRYLHTPLVMAADGHKLSKQNGATPVATHTAAHAWHTLRDAAQVLGLDPGPTAPSGVGLGSPGRERLHAALAAWTHQWAQRWPTI